MEEWIVPSVSSVIGGIVTAVAVVFTMRADIRNMKDRQEQLMKFKDSAAEDKFVTRKEFRLLFRNIRQDIHQMSINLEAIHKFLVENADRADLRPPPNIGEPDEDIPI